MTGPTSIKTSPTKGGERANSHSPEQPRQPTLAGPQADILALQSAAGNGAVSQLVQSEGGQPLAPDVRRLMETRFDYDFTQVRVHTNEQATASAGVLNAHAFTVGQDIVFGAGQYDPRTVEGRGLLAHELAHVVQSHGRAPDQLTIAPAGDAMEAQAERAALVVSQGGSARVSRGVPPAVRLRRDPRLGDVLAQLEAIPLVLRDDEETLRWVIQAVRQVDYSDPDNIRPITETLSKKFPHLVPEFLTRLQNVLEYQRAQRERTMRLMQPGRNILGHRVPGAVIPLVLEAPRAIYRTIENLFQSAAAFIKGLIEGVKQSLSPAQVQELVNRLIESTLLSIVFPPVFLSGVVVGIVEDVVDAIRGIYGFVTNFSEIADAAMELIRIFFTDEGKQVAYAIGVESGKGYGARIIRMLQGNIFKFTFDLGRLVGPMIVYTILAFLGVPELIAASIASRLITVLRPLLNRFPRLLRLAEAIAHRLRRRRGRDRRHPEVDSDIEEMVERGIVEEAETTSRPTRRPRPGRPITSQRAAAARRRFNTLRNDYAERLGVSSGGQVHHAIELQTLDRYPGVFRESELNAFPNMRGIATERLRRQQLHGSKIREMWDRHYRNLDDEINNRGLQPGTQAYNNYVRRYLETARDEIDYVLGQFFAEYRTGRPRSFD